MDKTTQFSGVWIPEKIIADRRLAPLEKLIAAYVISLCLTVDGCYASNEHIAKLFGVSTVWASNVINKLIKLEYCYLENFNGRRRILRTNFGMMQSADTFGLEAEDNAALNHSLKQSKTTVKPYNKEYSKDDTRGDKSPTPFKFLQSTFFQYSRQEKRIDPQWSGKEGNLLKTDMKRMQSVSDLNPDDDWIKLFNGMIALFFKDKVPKVAKFAKEAGYSYGVFHSQIDSILAWLDKES